MQQTTQLSTNPTDASTTGAEDSLRGSVANWLGSIDEASRKQLVEVMESVKQEDLLYAGLELYLDNAANARFLNTIRLEQAGHWLGLHAPDRLQIRLNEIARSSQHPAFVAFRAGLQRSGGLERAYPKARG